MKRILSVAAKLIIGVAIAMVAALPMGPADAAPCAGRAEYDNLDWGLTTGQVANRFGDNGWFIDTTENFFKRGYAACWSDDRKIVIWYDLDLGLSDHWDIRDR